MCVCVFVCVALLVPGAGRHCHRCFFVGSLLGLVGPLRKSSWPGGHGRGPSAEIACVFWRLYCVLSVIAANETFSALLHCVRLKSV